jgi:iron complex transport system substrate-binding protein
MNSHPVIHASYRYLSTVCLSSLLMILMSCSARNETKRNNSDLQENNDVSYAERFTLVRNDGYSKLTITEPWQGAEDVTQVWYLIRRGSVAPHGIDPQNILFVPVQKIICMSSTHLSMIKALDEEHTITGVSGAGFLYDRTLIDRFEKGLVKDVGYDDNLNKELIINISPDLVMVYGVGSESLGYIGKIKELGIKVLYNADYLETDPLGRAEWIKLFGALYCKEELAEEIFYSIVEEYNALKDYIRKNTTIKPTVLLGLPFKDTWFISPGNSYISRMISDAGGDYLWSDTRSSVSIPVGIENVFIKALDADYWLNIGSVNRKDEISAIDLRLEALPCFKNGNLYNNNKRSNSKGANDYWESGSLKPQIILKDIASVLHPGLFSDTDLFYYRKLD